MIVITQTLIDSMRAAGRDIRRLQHINLVVETVGNYMVSRYRAAACERGHFAVAQQLRKQGFPLCVARLILLGKN